MDTAFNYDAFTSHRRLAGLGSNLLGQFTISTKVGFFPAATGGLNIHSLDPTRLRRAVETAVAELGQRPEVVLLHNPERAVPAQRTVAGLGPMHDVLAGACDTLTELTEQGWCGGWGISCWDPRPLLDVLNPPKHEWGRQTIAAPALPAPAMLMVRAGLLVPGEVMHAGERLAALLGVAVTGRWGMSPFAGATSSPVWQQIRPQAFLDPQPGSGAGCSSAAAAFAIAAHLPEVARIAVGTRSVAHLRELVDATMLPVSTTQVARYRALLDQHSPLRAGQAVSGSAR